MAVRIGFIGTGGIANMHFNLLPDIDRAEPVAFCDISQEKAEAAAARFGGASYTDYNEMLDRENLDAIYICLPPFAHGAPEAAVVQRKLPMFVEKPLATDMDTARDIAEEIRENDLITCVGYNWRYMDITESALKHLEGNRPSVALGYWIGGTPGVAWWRVRTGSGGQIVEQTTHVFDFARYLLGEVTSVFGAGSKGLMHDLDDFDIEDGSSVTLNFESGAVATIVSSCVAEQGYGAGMQFIMRGKTIKVEGDRLTIEQKNETTTCKNTNNPYKLESELFLQAVETGDPSLIRSPYDDCLKSLHLTLAANQSMDSGEVVRLG